MATDNQSGFNRVTVFQSYFPTAWAHCHTGWKKCRCIKFYYFCWLMRCEKKNEEEISILASDLPQNHDYVDLVRPCGMRSLRYQQGTRFIHYILGGKFHICNRQVAVEHTHDIWTCRRNVMFLYVRFHGRCTLNHYMIWHDFSHWVGPSRCRRRRGHKSMDPPKGFN